MRTCFTPFLTGLAIMEEAFLRSSPPANVILFDREDPGTLLQLEQSYYTPQPLRRVKVSKLPPTELEFHRAREGGAKVFVYTFRKRGEFEDLAEFEKCWVVRSLADDAGLALVIPGVPLSVQNEVMVRQLWECGPLS